MSSRSDPPSDRERLRDKVIGLGARSFRKSYFPELQDKLFQLERFRQLLDDVEDAILLVTCDSGHIADANRFAAKRLGYERDTLRELPLGAVLAGGEGEARALLEGREDGAGAGVLTTLLTKSGDPIAVELSCRVSCYRDVVYASVVARDVAHRLRIEQDLKLARERAESAGRVKAALLEKLEEASRRKDEFLAMLGHELRNPLAPIATASELIRMRSAGAFQRELDVIERQVRHMSALVSDLLDVSRIARGVLELERERVEIGDLVTSALEIARPLLEKRGHHVEVDVPRGLPVEADRRRGTQIFVNLLTNAAKYTPNGGHVRVTGRRDGGDVVVEVRDDGRGISPDLLPRVFDLFSQGRRSIERAEGGLGLGLAIVKNLAELHGGAVGVNSALGAGSTFSVRWPAAPGAAQEQKTPALQAQQRAARGRVLLVDDNEDLTELLAIALGDLGFATEVAADGPSALARARAFAPTVAVLDIGLPVMDGYELARHLHELEGLSNLRLIAMSGYGQDADRRRSREAGFAAHILKPVHLEGLVAALAPDEHVLATSEAVLAPPPPSH